LNENALTNPMVMSDLRKNAQF